MKHTGPYLRLLAMTVLSFISMFVLMYAMVDRLSSVYVNINEFYMAGLMTAPMVIIELLLMGGMYPKQAANLALIAVSAVTLITCFVLIRAQAAVSDTQFLRSMIPHHSGAILMCSKAPLTDGRIKDLCKTIITGQQSEIDQMTAILKNLEGGN